MRNPRAGVRRISEVTDSGVVLLSRDECGLKKHLKSEKQSQILKKCRQAFNFFLVLTKSTCTQLA